MTHDYPDWTRLFHLVGTEITIPITIEASEVTIPVSIVASDITLNVYLGSMPFETTAENLLTNPGFETGNLTGWEVFADGLATVQSVEAWKGTYACAVRPPADGVTDLVSTTHIPCYPGQRILVAAAMKANASINRSELVVVFRSAEDEYLQTERGPDYGGDYDWASKVETFVVPDGAAFAAVGAGFWWGGAVRMAYVDSFVAARFVQPALDSGLNLNINIVAQEIAALDINIAAAAITVNINFSGQSIAVFDASKWFAHEAQQVFVAGSGSQSSGSWELVASRFVPANTIYFLTVVSIGYSGTVNANVGLYLVVGGTTVIRVNGMNGAGLQFDTPVRLEGYDAVELYGCQWGGDTATVVGCFGGYDEVEEEE